MSDPTGWMCLRVCVCVCVSQRERENARSEKERKREREKESARQQDGMAGEPWLQRLIGSRCKRKTRVSTNDDESGLRVEDF